MNRRTGVEGARATGDRFPQRQHAFDLRVAHGAGLESAGAPRKRRTPASGNPARPPRGRSSVDPPRRSALARADTAIVADSRRSAIFRGACVASTWREWRRRTNGWLYFTSVCNVGGSTHATRGDGGAAVEQEGREAGAVSRGQNVVYVMPHDWTSIAQFLSPAVERIDDTDAERAAARRHVRTPTWQRSRPPPR